MFNELAVDGIPLILVVFGLVEFIKTFGIQGRPLTYISLVLAMLLYFGYSYSAVGFPTTFAGWFSTGIVGICFGLVASGLYDFAKDRLPKVQ